MRREHYVDLAILGGGPAGYLAAVRGAQLGASVAIAEQDQVGGVCLNHGCIPTKALLRTAELAAFARKGSDFGVAGIFPMIDWPAGQSRKGRIVKSLRLGVEQLLQKNAMTFIKGQGRIIHSEMLTVETPEETVVFHCKKMLVATGSQTQRPPIPGLDLPVVLTSDEILELQQIPQRLAIIGGGAIGLEFAQMFHGLGTKVSVIEMTGQLLPQEDAEMAREVLKILKRQGIKIHLGGTVTQIAAAGAGAQVMFQTGGKADAVEADAVLLAVGRKPAVPTEIMALGARTTPQGALWVGDRMETSLPGIYAAGDVTGGKLLAHKAYAEGRVAVENALGMGSNLNYHAIPSCVYLQPELASVGINEKAAAAQEREVKTGRFEFRHNGRAQCLGEREGLVKVVIDKETHVVLGAQLFGPQATELITELTLAVAAGIKAEIIADLVHPHPTLSEAVMEACADAVGRAIHKG